MLALDRPHPWQQQRGERHAAADHARRVAELGAGLALDGGAACVPRLAAAVTRVLEEPRYRAAARRVAAEVGTLPPVEEAVADLTAIAQLQRAA